MAHQWIPFCTSIPLQCAIGLSLRKQTEINWFEQLRHKLETRRDALVNGLNSTGMRVIVPQGGYFVLVYTSQNAHMAADYARFAFCKSDTLIDAGLEKLKA